MKEMVAAKRRREKSSEKFLRNWPERFVAPTDENCILHFYSSRKK